ncbi:MAG: hypothetical protein K1X28_07125 [Parachlamydiales bacterium]|nr:hypothetical protein [Parachlamydiales bacterium]
MFNDRNQAFKTEFMMIQSCERRKDAMIYKNVNRKFLSFNLENHEQMVQVGVSIKPFGFVQHFQHKAIRSRIELLRIWAETQIAKRGARYVRNLYRENPEKFFDIQFNMEGSPVAEICQCKYILSDNTSQKTISLADEKALPNEMQQIRQALLAKEEIMQEEQKLAEEFTPSEELSLLNPVKA